ncbi:hypothetical protein MRX96_038175 [Rhipicephalus microplus]
MEKKSPTDSKSEKAGDEQPQKKRRKQQQRFMTKGKKAVDKQGKQYDKPKEQGTVETGKDKLTPAEQVEQQEKQDGKKQVPSSEAAAVSRPKITAVAISILLALTCFPGT